MELTRRGLFGTIAAAIAACRAPKLKVFSPSSPRAFLIVDGRYKNGQEISYINPINPIATDGETRALFVAKRELVVTSIRAIGVTSNPILEIGGKTATIGRTVLHAGDRISIRSGEPDHNPVSITWDS